jgi:hypothetical protein
MWGAIIGGVLSIASAGGGMMAAKRGDALNARNADLVYQESAEEERRLQRDIATTEGAMSAISAASGVQSTGTRSLVMKDVKKENQAQLAWLQKSGRQKADVVRAGGNLQSGQLKTQAAMTGIKGFAQIAGSGLFGNSTGKG